MALPTACPTLVEFGFISGRQRGYTERMKRIRILLGRGLRLLLLLWFVGVAALVGLIHQVGTTDAAGPADVIIVLGAGVRRDGTPDRALTRRANHAAELWRAGYAPYILCTGGLGSYSTVTEADACRRYLSSQGVPPERILTETSSRSTEENALQARAVMQARGWQKALLVSDSYHMVRANLIFQTRGVAVILSPVPPERIQSWLFYLSQLGREVVALHWQILKDALQLPATHVPLI